jgi:hypothetical protein
VYLVDADTGERIATMEGHNELVMLHRAREIVRRWRLTQPKNETK